MNTLSITKKILRENSIIAKKSYGQNFLIDDEVLNKIVIEACINEDDIVVEIGPGLGNLTYYLLQKKAKVVAFEIDEDMINVLKERFKDNTNLTIINQDILKANLREIAQDKKIKIIANLPYYITTPIIFKLLKERACIEKMIVMVQKEVAERIVARPKSKDYGILTINTNVYSDTNILFNVPNTSFIPAPKVTSSVIQIIPNDAKGKNIENKELFNDVVKGAFSSRRKKMINSLFNSNKYNLTKQNIEEIILKSGLDINTRAEEVDIDTFAKIANYINKKIQE